MFRNTISALVLCCIFVLRAEASVKLEFTSTPELIAGAENTVGAVYRFPNVADGLDANVELVALDGVVLLNIDDNGDQPKALNPVFNAVDINGSARLAVSLVDVDQESIQAIHTAVSVLGGKSVADKVSVLYVSDYTHELSTSLQLSANSENKLTIRIRPDSGDPNHPSSYDNVTATVFELPSLVVDIQGAVLGELSGSILFEPLSYENPVFHNTNDYPIAVDDANVFVPNRPLIVAAEFGLLANDTDIDLALDSDVLSVSSFRVNSIEHGINSTASMEEGAVTIESDGAYQFIPAANYSGHVTPIDYTVVDGMGGSASAALSLVSSRLQRNIQATASSDIIDIVVDEDINSDGYINREELEGQVDISVILMDGVSAGEQVTVVSGEISLTEIVTEIMLLERRVRLSFDAPVDGQTLVFAASLTDSNNELLGESLKEVHVDLTAVGKPSATIIADEDDSGFMSASEHSSEVVVSVSLPIGAAVNDIVYLDYGFGNESIVLTPLDIAEGVVVFTVPVAAEGETLSVVASIVDEADNRSESGSDSVLVDTVSPPVPAVDVLLSASSTPVLTGQYPADGDYALAVVLEGNTYVSDDSELEVFENGQWRLTVPLSDELEHGVYDVAVVVTDIAGNESTDTTTDELIVDLVAPVISVNDIAPSSDAAPIITGTSDATATGIVYVQNESGKTLCAANIRLGEWSCRVKHQLDIGDNNMVVVAHDTAGNQAAHPFSVQVVNTQDSDSDGIADDIEGTADTDGDSIADYLDLDSDNDGITDLVEGVVDTDDDGIRDYLDPDSDNDGVVDSTEAWGAQMSVTDTVGTNGIADALETTPDSAVVRNPIDTDGDLREDFRDLDSDNDGITDLAEQASIINHDGQSALDADMDGLPNYIDLDSDQDSIPDITEQQLPDIDANGIVDGFVDLNVDGMHDLLDLQQPSHDSDGDGIGNFIDLDSDGDGRTDISEVGGQDVDRNGRHDSMSDRNTNSISDDVDVELTHGADSDSDGIDDRYDADVTGGADGDGDGIVDAFDADADGDGLADAVVLQSQRTLLAQVYEFQPRVGASLSTGTGSLGSGCSLFVLSDGQNKGSFDPSLLLLLFCAFCALWRRIIRH